MSAPRPSLSASTWAAIAVHAAIAVAIGRSGRPSSPPPAPPTREEAAIDLDLTPSAPAAVATGAPAPERAAAGGVVASRAVAARSNEGVAIGGAVPEGTPAAGEEKEKEETTGPGVQLLRPGYGVTTVAPNPFLAPREPDRSPEEEANERAEQMLRQPARERELELGLGPDGPVRSALADAAAEGATDVTGRAVFRAVADGSGTVLSVTLLSSDGGHAGWSDAAKAALAKLQGTKLRLPSTAKRAEVTVEVTSDWKLPSGRDPGVDVDLFHVPVKKGEGKKSTKVSLLDPIPKLTTVELSKDVKIPVPQVQVTIVRVDGDPADIGAKPRRIVHTRLVESKVL